MRQALLLALTATATACSTSPPPAPTTEAQLASAETLVSAAPAPAPAALDPTAPASQAIAFAKGPFAPIASADGRWSMEIVALMTETSAEPGGQRHVSASVCFRPNAGDALVLGPPTLRLAGSAGAEPTTDPQWTGLWFDATAASLYAPVSADADRLGFAELRCRLMRVAEWRTTEVVLDREGQKSAVAAPFRLFCTPEPTWVSVFASFDEQTYRDADKAEVRAFGHRWASQVADITDARGAKLLPHAGSGSGGGSVSMHWADEGNGTLPVAYPVTVRLRIPARFDIEDAVFRLDGLALPRHAASD